MLVSHDAFETLPDASACGVDDLAPVSTSPSLLMAYLRGYLQGKASKEDGPERTKQVGDAAVFRTMVEHVNDAIVILQDGRIVYRNPAHRKLFGFPPGTEVSHFLDAIAPEDRERVRAYYQQRLQGEPMPEQYEFTVLNPQGQRLRIEVRPSLIDYEGRPATLVVQRDITLRKQAETILRQANEALEARVETRTAELQAANEQLQRQIAERGQIEAALRATETKYRTIIEQVSDAILVLQDGKTVYRNPAMVKLFGHTPEESAVSAGKSFLDFVAPEDRERVKTYYQQRLRGDPAPDQYELTIVSLSGKRSIVEINPCVIEYEGRPATLVVQRDITDRKEAEAHLAQTNKELQGEIAERLKTEQALRQAKEEAEIAAQAKSTFLATMSHEIRTPMNGVIGMADLLLDTSLNVEQRDSVEAIRRCGDVLLTVINDILDYSKIEAGKLELETIGFDLRDLVEDVLELLAEAADAKDIGLAALVDAGVPIHVIGDPARLRQILLNLISNAVKFTEVGEVAVRVHAVESTDAAARIRFEVQDTGLGIPLDVQPRLFQSFTQADSSTTRKHGGTGLGLAICKQLAALMGGDIGVRSATGQGSTFWFTVRLGRGEASTAPRMTLPAALEGLRVLCVDRHATSRAALAAHLQAWGIHVVAVETSAQALDDLRSASGRGEPYDLAFIDSRMPNIAGQPLVRVIKADSALAATRLTQLTLFSQRSHGKADLQGGFAGHVVKPVRRSQLYDCLVAVMDASRVALPITTVIPRQMAPKRTPIRIRVLLAEDNLVNQKVASRMLQKLGCEVDLAANGHEAVEALAQNPYDLVLMDCQMPEMDGFAATAAIRQREGLQERRVPIIAMTANAMEGDLECCLAAGMDDYLSKPTQFERLANMIGKWAPTQKASIH